MIKQMVQEIEIQYILFLWMAYAPDTIEPNIMHGWSFQSDYIVSIN